MITTLLIVAACVSADRPVNDQERFSHKDGVHQRDPELRNKMIERLLETGRGTPETRIVWQLHRADEKGEALAEKIAGADLEALATLLEQHLRDAQCPSRPAMALGMGHLGAPLALHRLIPALRDPSSQVREAAAVALGRSPSPEGVHPLMDALEDKEVSVRAAALQSLVDHHTQGVAAEQITGQFRNMASADDPEKRATGITGVARIEGEAGRDLFIAALADEEKEVRAAAIRAMGHLGDRTFGKDIAVHLRDEEAEIRAAAASALGSVGTSEEVLALIAALADPSGPVRIAAAGSLGRLRDPRSIVGLSILLDGETTDEAAAAAWALGQIGDKRAVPFLVDRLQKDPEREVIFATVGALGNLGSPEAVGPLVRTLNVPDPEVRKQVAMALGQIGKQPSGEQIVYLLRGERDDVRIVALKALGMLDYREGNRVVKKLMGEENPDLAYFAAATLYRFGDEAGIGIILQEIPPSLEMLRSPSSEDRLKGIDRVAYLAGEDFGYNPTSPAEGRDEAIGAIQGWWEEIRDTLQGESREDQDPQE